jgi:hypothetical protein
MAGAEECCALMLRPLEGPELRQPVSALTCHHKYLGASRFSRMVLCVSGLQEVYSETADVFSFAIIMYELLHRYMMISATDGSFEECKVRRQQHSLGDSCNV